MPFVVGSSVETARQFHKTNDLAVADRPKTAAGKYTTYNYSNITWSPYNAYWRQARKMCSLELFSARCLDSYEYIRVEEVRSLLTALVRSRGETVNLKDRLSTVSLNVISRMVLGRKYLDGSAYEGKTAVVSPDEFKRMLDELFLLNGVLNIGNVIPWIDFLDLHGYVRRMKGVSKKFDRLLEHVLDEHEERRRGTGDGYVASVEWAISELLWHPDVVIKTTEELDRVIGKERWVEEKDIPRLPYVESIVKETMRLHPVAPLLVPRYSHEDLVVSGYYIPLGTHVLVNVWTIGRDPEVWEKPLVKGSWRRSSRRDLVACLRLNWGKLKR